MGMAASQARLLALTTRMHNIELRAQNIEAQKLELAVREDEAYQKYCDAMDAKKIQVGYIGELGRMSYIDANYNSVCGYHDNYACQFSLINNKTGKVIVPQDIKDIYDEYGGDKYTFALMAAGYDEDAFYADDEGWPFEYFDDCTDLSMVGIGTNEDEDYCEQFALNHAEAWAYENFGIMGCVPGANGDIYMNEIEFVAFCYLMSLDNAQSEQLASKYNDLVQSSNYDDPPSTRQQLLNDFRDYLYQIGGSIITQLMNSDKTEGFGYFDNGVYQSPAEDPEYDITWGGEINYYMNLWEQIHHLSKGMLR